MKIEIPDIAEQRRTVFHAGIQAGIKQMQANLNAPSLPGQSEIDEGLYPNTHLLRKHEGWKAPDSALVKAYFRHFQSNFPQYGTDAKLAMLLGLSGAAGDRRIRTFKEGTPIPYGVWREFLVITGRVPQDVTPVLAICG
jgi:hypothetical protein